ncbi:PadR family transcriptional regulator [Hoyosella sp. G463]|uniref:PadR family transcriptional regulator n=1 Tax=Lolliginicoccus lacisalsi TaxID=2742202 RepID=A0A927JAV2_9ACTN|nr:PadR family transcriptional regulator [Lolliginicoccus lacisalsi]MBD8505277.1 PadR family transcriptional regulator [Lolliginicoccus lacisalsi]
MRHEHRNPAHRNGTHKGARHPRRQDRPPGLHIEGFQRGQGLIRIGVPARKDRNRRGDVRAAILLLLAEQPMHGYQLIQEIETRSEGAWKPSPGSIYPALAQLEDEGIVQIDNISGRKTASLTPEGNAYIDENRATLGDPFALDTTPAGSSGREIRQLARLLGAAAGQVAAVGTPAQRDEAAQILTDARKKLYRMLAGEE